MTIRLAHIRIGIAAAGLALALPAPARAQSQLPRSGKAGIDLGATLTADPATRAGTLPNGLRYFIRPNRRPAARAELRLVVDAGSVLETGRQRGLAHFVEHMAFNGTRRFGKQTLVDYLERSGMRFGAHVNAYTSFDETVYMLRVPTDRGGIVDSAFMVLEDWASGIAFDSVEVERERGVVIEEWRLGQGAGERVRMQQMPVLLAGSRHADRLPIGTRESLEGFEQAELRAFHRAWYRPELMTVIVVGDVDPDVIERRIRDGFAQLRNPADAPRRVVHEVPVGDTVRVHVASDAELTTSVVDVYFPHPLRGGGTVAAFRDDLVESLYNAMLGRRLAEITRRPDAPFVSAYSAQGRYVRSGEFYVLGAMAPEGGVEKALEALLREAVRVRRHGFTPGELDRMKADFLRSYEQAYAEREQQESDALAAAYVEHALHGEPVPGIARQYELVRALLPGIALADVNRLAEASMTERGRVVLASVPRKDAAPPPGAAALAQAVARAAASELTAYEDVVPEGPLMPTPPVPGRVVATAVDTALGTTTWTLSNGARVVVKPTDFKADEVLVSAFSPGGTSLVGDADALAAALSPFAVTAGGLGTLDADALEKRLAGTAAEATPYVAELTEGIVGSAAPRDLETFFQLFHLYVTAPRRDPAAYEAMQRSLRAAYENRALSPSTAMGDTLAMLLAQHHPRRRPITAPRLDSVSLESAFALYEERFRDAGDFTVVIVGAASLESLRPLVERYVASLPASGRVERGRDLGIRPPSRRVERVVRRGVEPQASTVMVFPSDFEYSPANRAALGAVAEALAITLREQLREALGATYGVSVGASASKYPYPAASLTVSFGSAPARADELVAGVLAAIDLLRSRGPAPEVLAKVKEVMLRERETNLRENRYWLERIAGALELDEDPRLLLGAEQRIRALGVAQVRDAARAWVHPGRFVRVTLLPE